MPVTALRTLGVCDLEGDFVVKQHLQRCELVWHVQWVMHSRQAPFDLAITYVHAVVLI